MTEADIDLRIAALAAQQHSVLTRHQALTLGLTDAAMRHRVHSGRWITLPPGTYAIAGSPDTWERLASAIVLTSGTGAAVSHLSAAAMWDLVDARPKIIDVTVPHARHHGRRANRVVHRARSLGNKDVRRITGIPVTCPARTLVDIAGIVPGRVLEDALDRALLAGLVSLNSLQRYIDVRCLAKRPGVGRLRFFIDDRKRGVPESALERRFLHLIRAAKLPEPTRQYRSAGRRLDFAYVDARIAIELDGFAQHRTGATFRDDRRWQNALILEGWLLLRFTWDDVTRNGEIVIDTLRRALAERKGQPANGED